MAIKIKATVKIESVEYTLPDFLACPLINEDYTGLNDEEYRLFHRWLIKERPGCCVDVKDDSSFHRSHDFHVLPLAADCSTFIFHKLS